VIVIT